MSVVLCCFKICIVNINIYIVLLFIILESRSEDNLSVRKLLLRESDCYPEFC